MSGITRSVKVVCPHCEHTNSILTWSSDCGNPKLTVCGDGRADEGGCGKFFVMKADYTISVEVTVGLLDFAIGLPAKR